MTARKQPAPKLSVCVMTYNQERYIAECLESIVTQKVDFPFEIIVADDASTDRTRDIVRDFEKAHPGLIRPMFHRENIGVTKNYLEMHRAARGDYVAHMDGDDLMLPGKLQRQADFLDANPGCAFVAHNCVCFSTNKDGSHKFAGFSDTGNHPTLFGLDYFVENNGFLIVHSSKMYRRALSPPMDGFDRLFDVHISLMQAANGTVGYLKEPLGAYRLNTGISVGRDGFDDHISSIEMAERLGAGKEALRYAYARACFGAATTSLSAGDEAEFRRRIEMSVAHGPLRRSRDRIWRGVLFSLRHQPALLRPLLDLKERFWRFRMRQGRWPFSEGRQA